MENAPSTQILCTKCKSPNIVEKCCAEFFDNREIPLCQTCKDWYCDRSQGISRDAKSMALYLMQNKIPVQVLDQSSKNPSTNYEIEMNFDNIDNIFAVIKPSMDKATLQVPLMTSGKLTFLFPNDYKDLFAIDEYLPKEVLRIFAITRGYGMWITNEFITNYINKYKHDFNRNSLSGTRFFS